jgi:hypothetical protein
MTILRRSADRSTRLPDVERERVEEAVVGWQKKLNNPQGSLQ